ncbi:hypothetical protein CVT24_011973 [Panaeolus cyanescens]|uniref:Uncharacterized protein n=1 Tax=Panaeolus cyanescens TaxID=181874 RepID=A0A409VZ03_9AGAR|nr:hypothetical protein CVT24_011973 [Panaeolus cyanescens]
MDPSIHLSQPGRRNGLTVAYVACEHSPLSFVSLDIAKRFDLSCSSDDVIPIHSVIDNGRQCWRYTAYFHVLPRRCSAEVRLGSRVLNMLIGTGLEAQQCTSNTDCVRNDNCHYALHRPLPEGNLQNINHNTNYMGAMPELSYRYHAMDLHHTIRAMFYSDGDVFTSDQHVLREICAGHSLPRLASLDQCRKELVRHLFAAKCSEHDSDGVLCRHIRSQNVPPLAVSMEMYSAFCNANGQQVQDFKLIIIARSLDLAVPNMCSDFREKMQDALSSSRAALSRSVSNAHTHISCDPTRLISHVNTIQAAELLYILSLHGCYVENNSDGRYHNVNNLRDELLKRIVSDTCFLRSRDGGGRVPPQACVHFAAVVEGHQRFRRSAQIDTAVHEFRRAKYHLKLLNLCKGTANRSALKRLALTLYPWLHDRSSAQEIKSALSSDIDVLKNYILDNGLPRENTSLHVSVPLIDDEPVPTASWPPTVSREDKRDCLVDFQDRFSNHNLTTRTCASCAQKTLLADIEDHDAKDVNLNCFATPRFRVQADTENVVDETYPDTRLFAPQFHPIPYCTVAMLHPSGIKCASDSRYTIALCRSCFSSQESGRVPPLSLGNHNFLGVIPEELCGLTYAEEGMLSLCRAKTTVLQLTEFESKQTSMLAQKALKGNIVVFPQNPSAVARTLPVKPQEIAKYMCVVFIGNSVPTREWLLNKAKPLLVRPAKLRAALVWLKNNNPLYRHVQIDYQVLDSLPATSVLPVDVHRYDNIVSFVKLSSNYDPSSNVRTDPDLFEDDVEFEKTCIPESVDVSSPSKMRAQAALHLKEGGAFVPIAHGNSPCNEFNNPTLFPKMYPTLYPYGLGGFENPSRSARLSMEKHVISQLNLSDDRFQTHSSFMFVVFNILQRRKVLLFSSNRVQSHKFREFAREFSNVSSEAIGLYSEKLRNNTLKSNRTREDVLISRLLNEINIVTRDVAGTPSSKKKNRNQIRALIIHKGLPTFFITINPADIYNPILSFLSGKNIDLDRMTNDDVPSYFEQACFVAKNPVVTAQFFDMYMDAFFQHLLRYCADPENRLNGVLGKASAYYGCVEAQGRGSLHCHLMVWLEGSLNPVELRDRILDDVCFREDFVSYLESVVCAEKRPNPCPDVSTFYSTHHPCKIRPPDLRTYCSDIQSFEHDLHFLVEACQRHVHTDTCFKYSKGKMTESDCRFKLGASFSRPVSVIVEETGEIKIKRRDGSINNFNSEILTAMRCNMDIKFIGSGTCAKALIFYVTDYITKTPLQAHVAFSALEAAVHNMTAFDPGRISLTDHSKTLLHKTAFSLLSRQELSAQQIAMFLLNKGDDYSSHNFRTFYWPEIRMFVRNDRRRREERLSDENAEMDIEPTDEDMEVVIEADDDGTVYRKASFLDDYRHRSDALWNVNLWDFIAKYTRVRKPGRGAARSSINSSRFFDFKPEHSQYTQYRMKRLDKSDYVVPTPVGGLLPRNDRSHCADEYRTIMLALFEPWSNNDMPHIQYDTVHESFATCHARWSSTIKSTLENVQVLHECKDSKDDDYYANRRNQDRESDALIETDNAPLVMGQNEDLSLDDVQLELAVQHVQQLLDCRSERSQVVSQDTRSVISAVDDSRIFVNDTSHPATDMQQRTCHALNDTMERTWEHEYKQRKLDWRKSAVELIEDLERQRHQVTDDQTLDPSSIPARYLSILDGGLLSARLSVHGSHDTASRPKTVVAYHADSIMSRFSLNEDQGYAFMVVARSLEAFMVGDTDVQLKMALMGAGGTGKSTVLNAISDLFSSCRQAVLLKKSP